MIHRTDDNYFDVVNDISEILLSLICKDAADREYIRENCRKLAAQAEWKQFITYYYQAFDMAFAKVKQRNRM